MVVSEAYLKLTCKNKSAYRQLLVYPFYKEKLLLFRFPVCGLAHVSGKFVFISFAFKPHPHLLVQQEFEASQSSICAESYTKEEKSLETYTQLS